VHALFNSRRTGGCEGAYFELHFSKCISTVVVPPHYELEAKMSKEASGSSDVVFVNFRLAGGGCLFINMHNSHTLKDL
jgi:hypothetical protein